ncbi:hypothetical protein HAX54_000832 [Datura stramonium]|uniref:DUF4283 domain-containing protein n=1 Tax=Datura stramonium TaxID=4076 RepID=A0ABS8RVF3_DATST|nr:hypothetical protein [Datura stramonium]
MVATWAVEAWRMEKGLNGSKLRDFIFLFWFTSELEAARVFVKGQMWMNKEFLRLDRWHASSGCVKGGSEKDVRSFRVWLYPEFFRVMLEYSGEGRGRKKGEGEGMGKDKRGRYKGGR